MKTQVYAKKRGEISLKAIRTGFTISVFFIILMTIGLFTGIELLLAKTGWLEHMRSARVMTLVICASASLSISGFSTLYLLHLPMKPIQKLLWGMTQLANGHFETRLDFGGEETFREMEETFNTLAEELENTEMLRSDFVNHFSHEIKTPVVSIRGFAKMLQRKDLTEQQREQYVDVIVEESTRLAGMTTNVLNLTRIEHQNILAHRESYNLSEQLRRCILLLERKWSEKELALWADFPEITVCAEREMMQQVWVNLLDNAVKFSPRGEEIRVEVMEKEKCVEASICNHGPQMTEEEKKRMFDKFWQGDASRTTEGTGIGLSVVKKIVELHQGEIKVESSEAETVFTVILPKE